MNENLGVKEISGEQAAMVERIYSEMGQGMVERRFRSHACPVRAPMTRIRSKHPLIVNRYCHRLHQAHRSKSDTGEKKRCRI